MNSERAERMNELGDNELDAVNGGLTNRRTGTPTRKHDAIADSFCQPHVIEDDLMGGVTGGRARREDFDDPFSEDGECCWGCYTPFMKGQPRYTLCNGMPGCQRCYEQGVDPDR